jgi:hypothetical protein
VRCAVGPCHYIRRTAVAGTGIRMAHGKRSIMESSSDAAGCTKRVKEQRYGDPPSSSSTRRLTSRGGDDNPIGDGTTSRKSVVRFSNAPGMIIWVPSTSRSSTSIDDQASSSRHHHTIGKHSSWYTVSGFSNCDGTPTPHPSCCPSLLDSNKSINAL